MEELDEVQRLIRYLSPSLRYRGTRAVYDARLLVFKGVSVLFSCLFRALLEGERMALHDANRRMTQQRRERVIGTIFKYKNTV